MRLWKWDIVLSYMPPNAVWMAFKVMKISWADFTYIFACFFVFCSGSIITIIDYCIHNSRPTYVSESLQLPDKTYHVPVIFENIIIQIEDITLLHQCFKERLKMIEALLARSAFEWWEREISFDDSNLRGGRARNGLLVVPQIPFKISYLSAFENHVWPPRKVTPKGRSLQSMDRCPDPGANRNRQSQPQAGWMNNSCEDLTNEGLLDVNIPQQLNSSGRRSKVRYSGRVILWTAGLPRITKLGFERIVYKRRSLDASIESWRTWKSWFSPRLFCQQMEKVASADPVASQCEYSFEKKCACHLPD